MNEVLKITNLCKTYPTFKLDNVSFSVPKGQIMGFIGRNGAGKTTTLKSLLDFVHPDSGKIEFFGKDFKSAEFEIKQNIGFVSGGVDYYLQKKLKTISKVTKGFYQNWDESAYQKYIALFKLDENKTPNQLSAGMKVKYSLALALSHKAQLLILDEPTSGLDPVSRDDLLDVFIALAEEGTSILFSTHITSDLDKCADSITYIKNGKIIASQNLKDFVSLYSIVKLENQDLKDKVIGLKRAKEGYEALVEKSQLKSLNLEGKDADLESIMVHFEKED